MIKLFEYRCTLRVLEGKREPPGGGGVYLENRLWRYELYVLNKSFTVLEGLL